VANLIKKIQNTIFEYNLFQRGDKIILGVSGGPDSVCLLDVFFQLKDKYDLEIIIAHVNYGLRGRDSDKDEELVRELAEKYKLEVEVLNVQNIQELSSWKPTEDNFRNIRYEFFERIRKEHKFDLIAVAHNQNDQVETILARLIRGSGLGGLRAMQFKNNRIIRPLLSTRRDEIINYLKQHKIFYRIDKTNLESVYLRNKIRNKLIPYLEKNFNPNLKKTLFDASLAISEDYAVIASVVEKAYRKNKDLSVSGLMKLPAAIQKRVLREAILKVKSDLKDIEAAHIREIGKVIKSTKGKSQVVLFQGLKITRKGDKLTISRNT